VEIESRPIIDEKTWIISDTHFGHANIVRYCNRPLNHEFLMMRNWKKLVKSDDVILHLGDVTVWYGLINTWAKRVKSLPGIKYLIRGNHDEQWTDEQWLFAAGMTVIEPFQQNKIYFSHEPLEEGNWEVNIHGHSHGHAPYRTYMKFGLTYYNASIEGMNYKPVRMKSILKEITKHEN
jgi:calcineurin-like phosphoesterase family protein